MMHIMSPKMDAIPARTDVQISGQIFVFFVLVVAAAEAAVGLALVIAMFRNRESLNVDRSNLLKW